MCLNYCCSSTGQTVISWIQNAWTLVRWMNRNRLLRRPQEYIWFTRKCFVCTLNLSPPSAAGDSIPVFGSSGIFVYPLWGFIRQAATLLHLSTFRVSCHGSALTSHPGDEPQWLYQSAISGQIKALPSFNHENCSFGKLCPFHPLFQKSSC